MTRADVVVIGAGLGGLSAATALARAGARVVLLERHNVPGGYATSFVRGRFEFEVALHELSGVGTADRPGPLRRYLDELGVLGRLELVRPSTIYRSVGPGLDLTLPPGWDEFEAALCSAFPDERRGIGSFLRLLRRLTAEVDFLTDRLDRVFSPALLLQAPLRCPNLIRYALSAFGPVLRRHVRDQTARAVLSQLWGYVGLPPDRASFIYFALTLASYITHGAAYPRGRSQALSNAFLETFEAAGGEARIGTGARRIRLRDGRVDGVITEAGELIETELVVSNADPFASLGELLDPDQVPRRYLRRLARSSLAVSSINVYLGLARPAAELGLHDHEIFVNRDLDYEEHYRRTAELSSPGEITVTCYNHAWPEISPPDTSMVVLTGLSQGRVWHPVSPADYVETKHRIAEGMLQLAEQVAPRLRSAVEVIEVSTPVTNMRYAGTLGGSIYGFANQPRTHTVFRIPHRSPVPGLFLAGAWTQPGGGFEPVIQSGHLAALAVAAELARRGPSLRLLPAAPPRPARQEPQLVELARKEAV